jgi:hypothetical protein
MPQLQLIFLGGFQAKLDNQPLQQFRSVNTQGLLVYLAMQAERPFTRETLAALFWPNEPDSTAKKTCAKRFINYGNSSMIRTNQNARFCSRHAKPSNSTSKPLPFSMPTNS